MITRNDYTVRPEEAAAVFVFHEGDLYPGADRRHLLQAALLVDAPPWSDAYVLYPSSLYPLDDPWTSLQIAQQICLVLCALPNVIQDLCFSCHPDRRRPNRPRWNIYHSGPFAVMTPCVIEDWF